MTVFMAAFLMQFVVSVKAGLVNHVQGDANVAEMEMARVNRPIRTGVDGYVEVLLRPGSFLRLGENSEAIIDDAELAHVKLTVTRGPAQIEVVEISSDFHISVTTGNLSTKIVASGIYRFVDGTASVVQGKLRTADSNLTYEKGWQIFFQDNYRARKTPKIQLTSLDVYSQTRSAEIAQANYSLASSMQSPSSYDVYDLWLFSQQFGTYTFIPRVGFRSPYGYQYYGVGTRRAVNNGNYGNRNNTTDYSSPSPTTPQGGGGNTNTGNNGGGGTASAPAPVASTPSGERTAPAVYIESKSAPVGATVP
jgi:hypothetical protein